MTLGIVIALTGEIEPLTQGKIKIKPGSISKLSDNVLLAFSGIGTDNARIASGLLLNQGATALLSWGSAAALSEKLTSGSLILPLTIIDNNGACYNVDSNWHERVSKSISPQISFSTDSLVNSPDILANSKHKQNLRAVTGAIAVDMESAAIGKLAHEHNIPFMVIRAIADGADMSIPRWLMSSIDEYGRIRFLPMLVSMVLHPNEWLEVARLNRGFSAALATLRDVISSTGASLLAPD